MTVTPAKRKPGRPRKTPLPADGESIVDPTREFINLDESFLDIKEGPNRSIPAPWIDKLHLDSRLTTLKLVALFRNFCALDERRIGQICGHAGLVSERGRGYELIPAVGSIIAYYKRQAERGKSGENADRDRQKKFDADTAELRARELAKELCPLEAAKQFWSDARVELRKTIEMASYLTKDQKKQLLEDFVKLKTKLQEGEQG